MAVQDTGSFEYFLSHEIVSPTGGTNALVLGVIGGGALLGVLVVGGAKGAILGAAGGSYGAYQLARAIGRGLGPGGL